MDGELHKFIAVKPPNWTHTEARRRYIRLKIAYTNLIAGKKEMNKKENGSDKREK